MVPEQEAKRTSSSDIEVKTHDDDALFFDEYVEALKELIEETETPFVLGIYGDWGVGKTSLMQLLQEAMADADHATVWFNPWKYDQRPEVWKALIREVYCAVRHTLGFLEMAREQGGRVLMETVKQAANVVGRITGAGDTGEELRAMFSLDPTFSNVFERQFDQQLRYLHEKLEGKRLVIFVDDLDRCSRPAVIEVLEALKLYLGREGCVFVLGVNQEVVQDAVEYKYRYSDEEGKPTTRVSGLHYLEKIVQLPFHIPPHDERRLNELLENLEVEEYPPEGIDDAGEWVEYVRRVGKATGNNPRQIKRFINTVHLIARIAPSDVILEGETHETPLDRLKLAKVVLIQFVFDEFYQKIRRYPDLLYRAQQYALAHEEQREKGEDSPADESAKARTRPEDWPRTREGFTLIDQDPELQQVLTEEPLWESAEEAGCYITYSGGGRPPVEPPDFTDIHEDLLSPDQSVVDAAAGRVKEQGPEAVEAHARALRSRLRNKSADGRDDAAWALGAIGDNRAVQLLTAAVREEDETMRSYAAWALGEIGDERAVEPLIAALQDEDEDVRWEAAGALGKIADERAVEPLIEALDDEDEEVREAAVRALELIDTAEARKAVEEYREQSDEEEE